MRKICVVVGSRANYSSIKSAMQSIAAHPDLELQVIAGASAVLDRYGAVVDLMQEDGFSITAQLFMLVEGETPATMAKSTGIGLMELSTLFEQIKPDIVITIGDRFETMATTLAAAYMNIPIAHTMGGEVSGTIDESIRHAVTKFAHIHFPASYDAKERIIKLGEEASSIHMVGCPRIDLVREIVEQDAPTITDEFFAQDCVGYPIDINKPFLLVSQHPVTTEYGEEEAHMIETLSAVEQVGLPAFILWPNADAGSDNLARAIRRWREKKQPTNLCFFKNLPIAIYVHLMKRTACLVGNSSSAIREGAFIGTPAVNIGSRQTRRERGENVLDAEHSVEAITAAIKQQIAHGPYPSLPLYGDGYAGDKIAAILADAPLSVQKQISY